MRFSFSLIFALLLSFSASAATVVGKVFLDSGEGMPGDYVMVYFPEISSGTMTDEWGSFSLDLPRSCPRTLKVEYSRIGYETLLEKVVLQGDITDLGTVILKEQTLMLTAAYVTPDGMSPSEYVMSKVWEKTRENRKKKLSYGADVVYDFSTHEIPLVASVFPKGTVGLGKMAAGLMGYGALVSYCLKNDDISATASLSRTVDRGKAMDYNQKIISSNPSPLPKNVQKDIIKVFHNMDLFDLVYGDINDFARKWSAKHRFTLVGTYEYNGKLVDVLSWTGKEKITINLHVVEEEWGFLKLQLVRKEGEVFRAECRDAGHGVYMPVSLVMKPTLYMVDNEKIPLMMDEVRNSGDFKKSTKERMLKVLSERYDSGLPFNPYFCCGMNVRYR